MYIVGPLTDSMADDWASAKQVLQDALSGAVR